MVIWGEIAKTTAITGFSFQIASQWSVVNQFSRDTADLSAKGFDLLLGNVSRKWNGARSRWNSAVWAA